MVTFAAPTALPPTAFSKRPTIGLKRDSSYLDTDDEVGLSVRAKKLKVAFDPKVDVRIMDSNGWGEKSFELVKEEVRLAVEKHLLPAEKGQDDTQYARLVQLLGQDVFESDDAASGRLLRKYIMALEARVSWLGECGKLAMAVLDLDWLGREEGFVAQYLKFLVALASAHANYLPAMMEKLVAHFAKLPASYGRLPEEQPVSRAQMFMRLHFVIKTLLKHIPSASAVLARAVKFEFPNDLVTTRSYIQYQKQLLRVAEYSPELKAEILALIVQRLVEVDVQIQHDIEDLEEEVEESLLHRHNPKDADADDEGDDGDESDMESVSSSEFTSTEEEQRLKELRLKVAKMDGTLDLMFQHYTPLVQDGSLPEFNEGFQQLIAHFMAYILPNRTRHAQFLLFHFAQTSQDHAIYFAERCFELASSNGNSQHRITAVAYLSSFVARGSHISTESVREIVQTLGTYLDDMRKRFEPTCTGPDRRSYAVYYAVSQALLYIFCFRWRDLVIGCDMDDNDDLDPDEALADGRDLVWLPNLKDMFHVNILSPINPLRVCSPAIVAEFADIARHVRLIEVLSKLESNKRVRLGNTAAYYGSKGAGGIDIGRRETAWDRKTGEAHHQLEAYFPFDPYHLPKSKGWVEGDYNEWKLPKGLRGDDDDEDDDEDDDDEDDDEDEEDEDEDEEDDSDGEEEGEESVVGELDEAGVLVRA